MALDMKSSSGSSGADAYPCECTKRYCIVMLTVNFMVCGLSQYTVCLRNKCS